MCSEISSIVSAMMLHVACYFRGKAHLWAEELFYRWDKQYGLYKNKFTASLVPLIPDLQMDSFLGVAACSWFDGTYSLGRIAKMLKNFHIQYDLVLHKIIGTTIDNGSNFVKAFKEYWVIVQSYYHKEKIPSLTILLLRTR